MAGNVSLNTVTDGLVMYLDAANTKSLADVPSRNLLLWSQQFDNWSKYQSTVSTDTTTAPDGTSTADTNIETSGLTGWRGVSQQLNGVTSGGTYTFSIYAKNYNGRNIQMTVYDVPSYANVYTTNFNLQLGVIISSYDIGNGVLTNSSIVSVGNGWYRCSISGYIPNATQVLPYVMLLNSGNTTSYTGDGVSGVYLWGGQMELGNVATTYIPTTTAAASRVPAWTDISKGGNNGTLTSGLTYDYSNGGSLVFNGTSNYVNCGNILNYTSGNFSFSYWIYVNSLTTNQSGQGPIILFKGQYQVNGYYDQINTGGAIGFNTNTNGVVVGSGTGFGVILTGRTYNICYTRNGSSIRVYVNGVDVTTYSGTHLDPVSSSSNFLINSYGGTIFSNVRTYSFSNYNRALSATEVLQNYNAAKSRFGL